MVTCQETSVTVSAFGNTELYNSRSLNVFDTINGFIQIELVVLTLVTTDYRR